MNLFEQLQRTTGTQLMPLLDISCDIWPDEVRLAAVNQDGNVVSNGNQYICFPFDFQLPQDNQGTASQMTLTIGNVGSDITRDLESWQPGHRIKAKLMLADPTNPNTIFKTFFIPISAISVTPTSITATCGNQMFLQQKASKLRYDQYFSPGLF